ncbi:hypothetical protein [Metabacillus arenae]|uniref:Uncharacterized protein n=1 Tax=Metabacillus arenae TaxID=2771434 RepID=A0A926NEW5_9BACI|nr:hypothetical protein [Metabacillus arenae]MBD1382972.1 hypothetical protein [Metabacillus arenae]
MKVVDQLKEFIARQGVIPKSIKIRPDYLTELELKRYAYNIDRKGDKEIKRFMGIELIPDETVKAFELAGEEREEQWIVKRDLKRLKEKYLHQAGETAKDINLLFGYIGYLERELEDKKNYLDYVKKNDGL